MITRQQITVHSKEISVETQANVNFKVNVGISAGGSDKTQDYQMFMNNTKTSELSCSGGDKSKCDKYYEWAKTVTNEPITIGASVYPLYMLATNNTDTVTKLYNVALGDHILENSGSTPFPDLVPVSSAIYMGLEGQWSGSVSAICNKGYTVVPVVAVHTPETQQNLLIQKVVKMEFVIKVIFRGELNH
eukprot:UN06515